MDATNISIEGGAAAEHQAAVSVGRALGTMGWDGSDPWEHFQTALAPAKPHQASDPAAAALRAVVKVRMLCRLGEAHCGRAAGPAVQAPGWPHLPRLSNHHSSVTLQADGELRLERFRRIADLGAGDAGVVTLVELRPPEAAGAAGMTASGGRFLFALKSMDKKAMEERNKVRCACCAMVCMLCCCRTERAACMHSLVLVPHCRLALPALPR